MLDDPTGSDKALAASLLGGTVLKDLPERGSHAGSQFGGGDLVSQAVISILSGPRFVQRGPTYRSSRSGRRDETDAVGAQAQPADEDGTRKGHLDRRAIEP